MASTSWDLNGNANNAATDFLGTTDGQPLVIKTAGSERVRVDATGNMGVGTGSPVYPVHLAVGKALRIEGGTGPDDTADYFSFGGNGSFGIDAPGVPDGRFVVQNDGQVGIGVGGGLGSLSLDLFVPGRDRDPDTVIPSGKFVVTSGGNVGIGMASPGYSLHLGEPATMRIEGGGPSAFSLGGFGIFGIDAPDVPNGRFVVDNSGNLGIGTPSPSHGVHLATGKALRIEGGTSGADGTSYFSFGGNGSFGIDAPGVANGRFVVENSGNVGVGNPSPRFGVHLAAGKALRIEGGTSGADGTSYFSFGGNGSFGIDAPGVANGRFVVENSGNVGVGNPSPRFGVHLAAGKALRIEGGTSAFDVTSYFSFGGNGSFGIDAPGVPNGRFIVDNSGNVGIGTPGPATRLHVAGDITVTGDVLLAGADCAEEFDAGDGARPQPGTVVVIDEAGRLRECRQAYDKRVAGVVSGGGSYRTALVLDRRPQDGLRIPVALVGKVYCKTDASEAPIDVGDLLTTSAMPGHAMKAAEPAKAFGAVIGKALQPLARGQGLIPILVALQ